MFAAKRRFYPEVDSSAKAYEPSNWRVWAQKLSSEFLGTFYWCYVIGILGVRVNGGVKIEALMTGDGSEWISRVVVAAWVAADILVCIILFSKVSCDLNPAVSFFRWMSKQNTAKYAIAKSVTQMVSAMAVAGALILTQYLSYQSSGSPLDNPVNTGFVSDGTPRAVDHVVSQYSAFIAGEGIGTANSSVQPYSVEHNFAVLGGEILGGLLLCWAIFSRYISSTKVREILIVVIVFLGVGTLLEIHTVGWNPARSLATNAAFDIASGTTEGMTIYWAYLVGPFIGALIMYYGTIFCERTGHKLWDKVFVWQARE